PDPAAGAFFDVDNTLMRGASIYYFARGVASRKMFGTRDLAEMAWKQIYFRIRGAENAGHIDAAREAALAFVAGHKVSDIVALSEEIYDEDMANRIWEGNRALAQRHLEAASRVGLVTATVVELASIIARRLGFTGALGTVAESVDGVHRAAGRRAAARRGEGGCDRGARPAGRPRPGAVCRLQRLGERHSHARTCRPPGRRQPRLPAARAGTSTGLAGARLPFRAQGHAGRAAHSGRGGSGGRRPRGRDRPPAPGLACVVTLAPHGQPVDLVREG